jgi:hypothetical protein
MSLNEKVDTIIEKINLGKLDSLIFTLATLLAIMALAIFARWLIVPNMLQSIGPAQAMVEAMFLCLFVPLLGYSYGSLADRINIRVVVIRIFLLYALLAILTACFVGLQSLLALLTVDLNYAFLLTISEYLSFLLFPVFSLVIILVAYAIVCRRLGHWLISQVPKKMESERIGLGSLFHPLPPIKRPLIKIIIAAAIVQLILIDALWAVSLRLLYRGLTSIPLLMGYSAFTIMAAIFILRGKTVYEILFHATARSAKLRRE